VKLVYWESNMNISYVIRKESHVPLGYIFVLSKLKNTLHVFGSEEFKVRILKYLKAEERCVYVYCAGIEFFAPFAIFTNQDYRKNSNELLLYKRKSK